MATPESASDITVDWLKNALAWEHPGCEPVSVEVEPNFGGPSLLGSLARVRLTYAASGCGPPAVIVKFQARTSDWEAQIYRLLSEAGVAQVPRLFGAFERGTLVMEGCPGYFGDNGHVGVVQPNLGLDALFGAKEDYVEFTPDIL